VERLVHMEQNVAASARRLEFDKNFVAGLTTFDKISWLGWTLLRCVACLSLRDGGRLRESLCWVRLLFVWYGVVDQIGLCRCKNLDKWCAREC